MSKEEEIKNGAVEYTKPAPDKTFSRDEVIELIAEYSYGTATQIRKEKVLNWLNKNKK